MIAMVNDSSPRVGELPAGRRRLVAAVVGILVVAVGLLVGLIALVSLGLYAWEICATGYDLWNAALGGTALLSALSFGGAGLFCLAHAVTLSETHIIKPTLFTGVAMLAVALGLSFANPTPDAESGSLSEDSCYDSIS